MFRENLLRALKHRNYRLFFSGQIISLIGTWIQQLAMSWLAYRLTRSPLMLGVIGFTGQIPVFFLSPFAGVLSDRLNRHRLLIITQSLAMVQALTLAILVLTGTINIVWLVGLSLFLGTVNAFDIPIRQSFVVQMVDNREDLGNAIALNSTMINSARMIGPSIAGILVSLVGEGICFLINGLSYLAVIWALLMMKVKPRMSANPEKKLLSELKEGFTYVFSFPPLRSIILLVALISLVGMSYVVILPVYVKDILKGGAYTQGMLMSSVGLGALLAALFLASRPKVVGLESYIPVASGVIGIGLIGFSFVKVLWLALPMLFIIGLGMIIQMASANTIIQTIVEEDKRGRVMSIYTMAFMGMGPFGSLLIGSLAEKINVMGAFRIGGIFCLAGAVLFILQIKNFHHTVRSIYLKMGLISPNLPELETIVESSQNAVEFDERQS